MQTQSRVVGSQYTALFWNSQIIAWLQNVQESPQTAIGGTNGYQVIQPLGANTPTEIVTGRALGVGSLSLSIQELWNAPAWQQLQGLATNPITGQPTTNIVDIFAAQAATTTPLTIQMVIKPPNSQNWRGWVYNNCTVVGIGDGETVSIGTLTVTRQIAVLFTSKTYLSTSGVPTT